MGLRRVMNRIPDVIVMKGHDCVIGSHTGLRMMIVGAGTAAGAAAGEEATGAGADVVTSCGRGKVIEN